MVSIKEQTFNEIRKLPIHLHRNELQKGGAVIRFHNTKYGTVIKALTMEELEIYLPFIANNIKRPGKCVNLDIVVKE